MKTLSKTKRKEVLNLIRFLEAQTRGEQNEEKLEQLTNQIYNLRSKI